MQRYSLGLLFFYLFLCFLLSAGGQNCQPSDACATAPYLNLTTFICSTAGFTASGEGMVDDCLPIGQPLGGTQSDFWAKFVPLEADFSLSAEVVNSLSSGNQIQAMIYKDCAGPMLDCTPDCGVLLTVGTNIQWSIGDTYLLRIRSCTGMPSVVKIATSKKTTIQKFIAPFPSNWPLNGLISGKQRFTCQQQVNSYVAPFNSCAPVYIWRIESGNAAFRNFDLEQTVDLNPLQPNTTMIFTGNQRNLVYLQNDQPKTGEIHLTVQLYDGTDSTYRTSLKIVVDTVEYLQRTLSSCASEKFYQDPTLPGSPFPLSDTCGVTKQYKVLYDEAGCRKNLTLNLIKDCDTIVPVPLIVADTVLCLNYNHSIEINNFSANFQYDWIETSDSVLVNISGQMMHCLFFHPGKYTMVLKVSNACLSDTFKYHFTVDDQLPTPYIHGLKVVTQKSIQTYCVYSPTPDVIWKSSKGLKYKQNYKNGQSCIAVTFAKLTNTGWLIASHSNSCGTKKDSIYVFVKPKTASAETVPINATSDQIETRQGDSFSNAVLELFPSPAKDLLQIKCNLPFDRVLCADLLGRAVVLKTSDLGTYSISFLQPGLYQISIYKERHRIATQKFVKID